MAIVMVVKLVGKIKIRKKMIGPLSYTAYKNKPKLDERL